MVTQKHYHLIGIGGIGMSGIAQLLLRRGNTVSGSDIKENKSIEHLKKLGACIFIGHAASNIRSADVIVYSSAIKEDNPEMREAKKEGFILIKRAEALADLMKDKTVITVTGSHGKTTTSSLVAYMLLEAGLLPTIAIGGILKNIDTNASFGEGRYFVAEADESDGSFLYYSPTYSIITNIDYEHLDYYKDFQNVVSTFKEFIEHTQKDGSLFCCSDDAVLMNIVHESKKKHILFGLDNNADIYPKNAVLKDLTSQFDCIYHNKLVDRFYLALGGRHNISNALSVIALGLELGIDLAVIKKTLAQYQGAGRRLEVKLKNDAYTVIDDYAHHPTEIKATLQAVKNLKANRIIVVFQPHRYTRTKLLMEQFAKSFDLADCVVISDIYAASEKAIEGVSAQALSEAVKRHSPDKEVVFLPKEEILDNVLARIKPHDIVITLGAGDITKISDELAEKLKKRQR